VDGERMQRFNALSGWISVDPGSSDYSQNNPADGWWYLTDAAFASDYAKEYPGEDFAESFSAFFSDRAGWTFYGGEPGAAAIPEKIALFNEWLPTV